MQQPAIRPGRDADADGVIALIGRCWADYPGCVLDVDAEAPELRALASWFARQDGALFVAEDAEDRIVGMAAACPVVDITWEMCRVYVHPELHGGGLGHRLLDGAERFAVGHGARILELWSDTRFLRAHRFYEKRGYRRAQHRALDDMSDTFEVSFVREVPSGPSDARG